MGAIVLNWFILNIYSFTCSLMFWVHISKLRDRDHRIIFSGHSALPSVKKRNSPTKQHLLYWATYVFGCWTPATHQPITQGIYGAVAYCRKKEGIESMRHCSKFRQGTVVATFQEQYFALAYALLPIPWFSYGQWLSLNCYASLKPKW